MAGRRPGREKAALEARAQLIDLTRRRQRGEAAQDDRDRSPDESTQALEFAQFMRAGVWTI